MTPPLPPLVTVAELRALLKAPAADTPPPVVLDCRFSLPEPAAGAATYAAGHVPGAHHADLDRDLSGARTGTNGRHPLPSVEDFRRTLSRWGVRPGTRVIAYDASGGMFAARAWWMLRWAGHPAVQVLDGGWPAWCAEGGPVSLDEPAVAPLQSASGAPIHGPAAAEVVTTGQVLAGLPRLNRDWALLDARAADRFRGENETLDPVGGHIPGALNRFFQLNLAPDGRFKPAPQLREEFAALLGDMAPSRVVHQCGSGVTACHNLLAMEHAGLAGSHLYAGSWSAWCADPARPVARGDQTP